MPVVPIGCCQRCGRSRADHVPVLAHTSSPRMVHICPASLYQDVPLASEAYQAEFEAALGVHKARLNASIEAAWDRAAAQGAPAAAKGALLPPEPRLKTGDAAVYHATVTEQITHRLVNSLGYCVVRVGWMGHSEAIVQFRQWPIPSCEFLYATRTVALSRLFKLPDAFVGAPYSTPADTRGMNGLDDE